MATQHARDRGADTRPHKQHRLNITLGLIACLLLPSSLWALPAHVQSNQASGNPSSGSIAVAYPGNVTAGSLGVACVVADNIAGTTVSGVVGSSSGSWSQAVHAELAGDQIPDIWYKENMAGGADTITATYNAAKSALRIVIAEYSGVATSAALDKVDSNVQTPTSTSTDATTSTTQTTTTTNQLIVGCVHVLADPARGVTAGTGFSERQDTDNDAQVSLEDRVEGSATSVAATFTLDTAVNTITALATFKDASGGGATQNFFYQRRPQ